MRDVREGVRAQPTPAVAHNPGSPVGRLHLPHLPLRPLPPGRALHPHDGDPQGRGGRRHRQVPALQGRHPAGGGEYERAVRPLQVRKLATSRDFWQLLYRVTH